LSLFQERGVFEIKVIVPFLAYGHGSSNDGESQYLAKKNGDMAISGYLWV